MRSWKKLFSFPGPTALGLGDSDNSMAMRDFLGDDDNRPTWEDYEEKLKEMYPVRYWFAYTARNFLRYKIWIKGTKPFKDAWYWLKCHTLKEYKFHLIDIRDKDYDFGYRDTDERIMRACFSLLTHYIEEENPYCPTEDDIAANEDECFRQLDQGQHDRHLEAKTLYDWWHVGRFEEAAERKRLLDSWYELFEKNRKSPETKAARALYNVAEEAEHTREEEMLIRLMKIRKSLWT